MNRTERELQIRSSGRNDMVEITGEVQRVVRESGIIDGICLIYIPHTTCGLTINENADPAVKRDMTLELDKMVPWEDGYSHMEGNSAAHIKASLYGFSQTIPIVRGGLPLGTWQGIYLCEFDGPRTRRVQIHLYG